MRRLICVAVVLSSMVFAGCTTNPYTGEQEVSKTAIGAAAGAILGAAVSGKKDRAQGALIGAAVGGGTGYYFDRQEQILRQKLQGTGVSVTRTPNGITLNMPGNISFPVNQYAILPSFYDVLNSVAIVLKEFDKTAVKVSGFTDSTGSFQYNQKLSEERANSVAEYLATQGVAQTRLQVNGYGPRYPIATNKTAEGRAANRRVEIQILNP